MPRLSRMSRLLCTTVAAVAMFSTAVAVVSQANASTIARLDLDALSVRSDKVLVGTVESVRSRYVSGERRGIVTDVTLLCDREILGVPAGRRFVVRHLGGEVEGRGQRVFGEASYELGEQVLLFATKRSGAYWSVGMAQGALHVRRDETGLPRVRVNLAGAELVASDAVVLDGRPLDEVVEAVKAAREKQ